MSRSPRPSILDRIRRLGPGLRTSGGLVFTPPTEEAGAATAAIAAHVAASDPHTGYVLESLIDAKGDLIVGTADNTPGRLVVGANGEVLTADSSVAGGMKWAGSSSEGVSSGTAFPSAPSDGDLFYRTDLGRIYFYDDANTRWLSVQQFVIPLGNSDFLNPRNANTTPLTRCTFPYCGVFSFLVERFQASVFCSATNNGSNFFTVALTKNTTTANTQIASFTTSAQTQNQYAAYDVAVDTVLDTTIVGGVDVRLVETGTVGNCYVMSSLVGRLVG